MQDSISIGISLPKEVVLKIDSERHDIPRSRYLLRILERALLVENRREGHHTRNKNDSQDSLDYRIASLRSSESSNP